MIFPQSKISRSLPMKVVLPYQINISVDQKVLTFALREDTVVVTNALSKMERLFDKQSTITQEKHRTRVILPAFPNPTRKVPISLGETLPSKWLMWHPKQVQDAAPPTPNKQLQCVILKTKSN